MNNTGLTLTCISSVSSSRQCFGTVFDSRPDVPGNPRGRLVTGEKTYTVRRARPLARRRAKTFRPFLVLMRFRNPCSRLRLRLDGCLKVNDIALSLSTDRPSEESSLYGWGGRVSMQSLSCSWLSINSMGITVKLEDSLARGVTASP